MIQTIMIILEQVCLYVPLICGAYISFSLLKLPDISIESAYVFGAICAYNVIYFTDKFPAGISFFLAIVASIIGGMIVGCIVTLLTRIAHIPHLLASILTIGLFHGINQFVLGGAHVSLSLYNNILSFFSCSAANPELSILLIISAFVIVLLYLFFKTQIGFCGVVYGNNPSFFEHYRISSHFIVAIGLIISNGLAGLSGFLVAQTTGFVDINAGFGIPLFCVTTLILGKLLTRFSRSLIKIGMPILGLVCYMTIQQLLLKVGFNLKYFTMVQSIIVIVLLVYAYRKHTLKVHDMLGI